MQAEEIGGTGFTMRYGISYPSIRGSRARIEQMITHTFPIDRIAEAMDVQLAGQCGKVIVHPWED